MYYIKKVYVMTTTEILLWILAGAVFWKAIVAILLIAAGIIVTLFIIIAAGMAGVFGLVTGKWTGYEALKKTTMKTNKITFSFCDDDDEESFQEIHMSGNNNSLTLTGGSIWSNGNRMTCGKCGNPANITINNKSRCQECI